MLNMFDTGRLEAVYEDLGLIGPARPGEALVAASVEAPLRTGPGLAYWPAPPRRAEPAITQPVRIGVPPALF